MDEVNNIIWSKNHNVLDSVKKPPTNGRKLNRTYCNDTCHNYKSNKPNHGKNPYDTHVTCTKCDNIWMLRESCAVGKNGALRCPCYNIQCRTKAKRKHGGETTKLYTKQSGV